MVKFIIPLFFLIFSTISYSKESDYPTISFNDQSGQEINAHGGNIIYHNGYYYWVGEYRVKNEVFTQKFSLYKSKDLRSWFYLGIIYDLSKADKPYNIERPKLIYNNKNRKFILWYHEEIGKIFNNAKVAVAVSNKIDGQYKFYKSYRPNAGVMPIYDDSNRYDDQKVVLANKQFNKDFKDGQMSRDMNIFEDSNNKAYLVSSAEDNKTIQISELNSDYTGFTGIYSRILAGRINEAPALFKRGGEYYLFTSGVTGYRPTLLKLAESKNVLSGWHDLGIPTVSSDKDAVDTSFYTQVSSVLKLHNQDKYIFIADRWNGWKLYNSKYVWLNIHWENERPYIYWDVFKK